MDQQNLLDKWRCLSSLHVKQSSESSVWLHILSDFSDTEENNEDRGEIKNARTWIFHDKFYHDELTLENDHEKLQ